MDTVNYADLFERSARLSPGRPALVDETGGQTYAEVRSAARRFAHALIARGFEPSSPYAFFSVNAGCALVSHIGAMMAGGAWTNINIKSTVETNAGLLNRAGCKALFYHSSCKAEAIALLAEVPCLDIVVCLDADDGRHPSLARFIEDQPDARVEIPFSYEGVGFMGTTGGTTGAPKITRASHAYLALSAISFMACFQFTRPPVNLAVAPITHAGGVLATGMLAMGGTVVLITSTKPADILAAIQKHQVSAVFLPPTLIYTLLNEPGLGQYDLTSLKYVISAAAPIDADRIRAAFKSIGPVLCQAYGQTESGMPLTFMSPREIGDAIADDALAGRLASVGRPVASLKRLEIIDDDGNFLEPGAVGEIVISGPTVMREYLGDPEGSAEATHRGMHRTGDLGYLDNDGYLYITDRKRDLIISGGFNVYPSQIEKIVLSHPAVLDCAVIGVAHPRWGEAVTAVVQTIPGKEVSEREIVEFTKLKAGSINAPKYVRIVEDLPKNSAGKILKRELRKLFENIGQIDDNQEARNV
ncbi:class I adenylate-forming enzyme family protein [Rhizobium sp. NZLR11]|uniref:class I adenylate-forming enzyme family protein n=1 Tax=Rhizobium sp. NZLR11 TaxID=2731098 RepID=UPI001C84040E|nr:AMP-binding protein [Rhizobium sp. NZLR11]MBX5210475.1 AMP-binding protein [Rhizobium sp. NZLR11]